MATADRPSEPAGAGVLLGRSRSVRGRVWAVLGWTAGLFAAGAGVPWALARAGVVGWPDPASWYGVLLGFGAGLIVVFEMLLLPRKWLRGRRWALRAGRARVWMRLHVWLGLVCLPVTVVHAGFRFGGPLTAVTLVLFLVVTASGVWGLLMQQWLPSKILAEVTDETVASQVDRAAESMAEDRTGEAFRLVGQLIDRPAADERAGPLVAGASARALTDFRDGVLVPYLRAGRRSGSPLASPAASGRAFDRLRAELPAAARPAVDRLEGLAEVRRQWDALRRLNAWLHNWLAVHLPLAVAMTGLMLVHAVRALKYW